MAQHIKYPKAVHSQQCCGPPEAADRSKYYLRAFNHDHCQWPLNLNFAIIPLSLVTLSVWVRSLKINFLHLFFESGHEAGGDVSVFACLIFWVLLVERMQRRIRTQVSFEAFPSRFLPENHRSRRGKFWVMVTREIHTFLAMESTWYDAVRAWNVEEMVVYDTSPRLFPVRSQAGSGVGASRVS